MVATSSSPDLWSNCCCLGLQQPVSSPHPYLEYWSRSGLPGWEVFGPLPLCVLVDGGCYSLRRYQSKWFFFLKAVMVSEPSLWRISLVSRNGRDPSCFNFIVNLMVGSIEFRWSWNCWICPVGQPFPTSPAPPTTRVNVTSLAMHYLLPRMKTLDWVKMFG